MKYRLGLDLGVGSIGSAVIELDDNNNAKDIKDAGVRIFEVSEGAEERRTKRTARKNLIRTKKRLELLAKKLFENGLWVNENPEGTKKLRSKSPYKIRSEALNEKLESPCYIGRAILHMAKHRGAGFVDAVAEIEEEVLEEGEKSKAKLSPYETMAKNLKDTNSRTIGEFFYKRIKDSYEKKDSDLRTIRQKKYALEKKIIDYAIPRYLVKEEFNRIWDKQAEYFPQMQKNDLKQEIYDILFYERPAAPYALANCIYIKGENRISKANPLSEKRRIYEEVNNIRIINDLGKRELTLEERDKIIDGLLLQGKNAGKQAIKKLLNLNGQQKISLIDDKVIKAYLYSRPEFAELEYLQNLSEDEFADFIEFLAEPVNPNDKLGRLFTEDKLIAQLKTKLKIDEDKQISSLLTKLPKGRGMLGKTATRMLLEKMVAKVITHREASDKIAKTDKRFEAEEEAARRLQGKCFSLPYYGKILTTDVQPIHPWAKERSKTLNSDESNYGKIANPAVHMVLNQIRLVVNDIIKIYGRPNEINIELGRDIGMSTKKKKELETKQRANEKLNDEAKKYLIEHKIPITGKNILKCKLAKEQGWMDAYNPTGKISQRFEGFEIEHIIPQAKGGTDTYNNLCLVNRNDNLNKGDRFVYDYLEATKKPEEIREIMKNARERLKNKSWRFESDAREKFEEEGDNEETNRYLTDTRYVSKMAQRYLRSIIDCEDSDAVHTKILAVKGAQTAKLREKWNLEGLEYNLMGLNIPRHIDCSPYWLEQETGEVVDGINKPDIDGNWRFFNKKKNKEWNSKPRIDHRHHAMDAIVAACVNRSLIQKMSTETYMKKLQYPLPLTNIESTADFRRRVIEVLKEVKVSHKPNHAKSGQLHEETGKVKLCHNPDGSGAIVTTRRRKILSVIKEKKDINKLLVSDNIKDEWYKSISEDRIKQKELADNFNKYWDIAEQTLILEDEEKVREGSKAKNKITDGRIVAKTFHIIQKNGLWIGDKFVEYENLNSFISIPKHNLYYTLGNNDRADFYELNGKVNFEVINRFDANQFDEKGKPLLDKDGNPKFEPKWKKNGGKIIWSLKQGDLLEIDTPEKYIDLIKNKRCIIVIKSFRYGRNNLGFILSNDARNGEKAKSKPAYMLPAIITDVSAKWLCDRNARKIELTSFGKVKKKHKALWNGKKEAA